jgi:diacylglycerol kinase (ATP)
MESPHKGKTGLVRLKNALGYSLAGFRAAYKHEDAFRQEVLLAAILVPLAASGLPVGYLGKALMIGSVLLVIIVELLNSAIEATVDRISLDNHDLAKRAKDIGSAAVLVSLDQCAGGVGTGFGGMKAATVPDDSLRSRLMRFRLPAQGLTSNTLIALVACVPGRLSAT